MPPKKDNSKSTTTEPSEDEVSCRDQLETLQLQLEEARAAAREAQERALAAEGDREEFLGRIKDFESCAEDEREKVRQLCQKLSQNYEHLERCTRDNARLADELVEKSREVNAVRRAASVTQQTSNMRNHFHQHGTSPPVSPIMLGTS